MKLTAGQITVVVAFAFLGAIVCYVVGYGIGPERIDLGGSFFWGRDDIGLCFGAACSPIGFVIGCALAIIWIREGKRIEEEGEEN